MNDAYWTDNSVFQKSLDTTGNIFQSVLDISNKARKLFNSSKHFISVSDSLRLTTVGNIDHSLVIKSKQHLVNVDALLENTLEYCTNRLICESVKGSIQQSLDSGYLVYSYQDTLDCIYHSRVRILCNMFWIQYVETRR